MITVQIAEKQGTSAAITEILRERKGFDLPAQVQEFILDIYIPGRGEGLRAGFQFIIGVPGLCDVDRAILEIHIFHIQGDCFPDTKP